jgi:hypothetical protein
MSSDKTLIVGTATDTSGGSPRYVLRLVQITQLPGIPSSNTCWQIWRRLWSSPGHHLPHVAHGALSMMLGAVHIFVLCGQQRRLHPAADETYTISGNGALASASDAAVHGTLSYSRIWW